MRRKRKAVLSCGAKISSLEKKVRKYEDARTAGPPPDTKKLHGQEIMQLYSLDCAPHPKSLVYWESKEGTLIDFSGKPFIRIGRKIFVCHLGPDKNKMQKENNRLKMLNEVCIEFTPLLKNLFYWIALLQMQDDRQLEFQKRKRVCKITKKRNCPARIYCSHVIEFLNDSVQVGEYVTYPLGIRTPYIT